MSKYDDYRPLNTTTTDKRELFRTAQVACDTKLFKTDEIVAIRVRHRMVGACWVYTCRKGERVEDVSEGFLKNFTL